MKLKHRRLERSTNRPTVTTNRSRENVQVAILQAFAQSSEPFSRDIPSFNDPAFIRKICAFHDRLLRLESSCCSVCLEHFPSISVNVCRRCTNDKHIPTKVIFRG